MSSTQYLFFFLLFALFATTVALKLKAPEETRGVLLLDAVTFPKMVPSKSHYLVVQITNKHTVGDYGTDSIRADYMSFAQFAQTQGEADDIVFAQIIVNGAENQRLAKRIGVKDGFRFPTLFIFPAGSSEGIQYPENKPYHPHDLARFLSQHTNFYYHIPGTSKTFDQLSKNFIQANSESERATVLSKAREELNKITDAGEKDDMKYYVEIMEQVTSTGDEFIYSEIDRLTKIVDNKQLAKEKRNGYKAQISVLKQFAVSKEAAIATAAAVTAAAAKESPITATISESGEASA